MHHIYHTEGIILESRSFGEAGKYYSIFTRDLGMIFASAQGVRKMSSKLRYVLSDFACVKVDLVRGANFWRLTSASKTNSLENLPKHLPAFKILNNISRLLKRLLAGEDANPELYEDVIGGLTILEKADTPEEFSNIEAIMVLRILSNLGYVGGDAAFLELVKSPFEKELIFEAAKKRAQILKEVNRALKQTHL